MSTTLLAPPKCFPILEEAAGQGLLCLLEASGAGKRDATCSCWEPPEEPSWGQEGGAKSISKQLAPGPVVTEPASHEATLRLSPTDLAWRRGRQLLSPWSRPCSNGYSKDRTQERHDRPGVPVRLRNTTANGKECPSGVGQRWKRSIRTAGQKALGNWTAR